MKPLRFARREVCKTVTRPGSFRDYKSSKAPWGPDQPSKTPKTGRKPRLFSTLWPSSAGDPVHSHIALSAGKGSGHMPHCSNIHTLSNPEGIMSSTPPNSKVATAATQAQTLPLSGLTLIGTFLAPQGARAILRHSAGTVKKVTTGDTIAGHVVTAINDGTILLARNGQSQTLSIPGQ